MLDFLEVFLEQDYMPIEKNLQMKTSQIGISQKKSKFQFGEETKVNVYSVLQKRNWNMTILFLFQKVVPTRKKYSTSL